MNKSILILEENSMIHGLIASALDLDGLTLHHEFDPEEYVERAKTLMPDLILLSNADQQRDYSVCRELKRDANFREVPVVLLAGSKDRIESKQLRDLSVSGVIRKPFEASDLQQQVSKHLNLVDLIGSAYDYKKSQSLRDEGMGPLADMEVLDQEILSFLHESADVDTKSQRAVPKVDFSRELAGEAPKTAAAMARAPAPPAPPRAAPPPPKAAAAMAPAAAPAVASMVEESALEDALRPEQAFEPLPDETMESAEPFAEDSWGAAGDVPLAGQDFDESAAAEQEAPPFRAAGEALEELGEQDVLDEGADEEARWAPEGFDQEFGISDTGEKSPLPRVEMELAGADVDFDAAREELDEGEVELFESDFGETDFSAGGRPARPAEDESIPEAVRRMVEMKPVLTMARPAAAQEEAADVTMFSPDDAELSAMAAELEQMDEFHVAEPAAEAAPEGQAAPVAAPEEAAAAAEDWQLAPAAVIEAAESEEFFHEDYLGDDEIDEEKIRSALETSPSDEPEFEVILDEDSDEDFESDELEDAELKEIEALDSLDLDFTDDSGDDEEEIIIDPDEESMVLASIEQDEALERAGTLEPPAREIPVRAEPEAEPRLEAFEAESFGGEPDALEDDLLDRQLDALEETGAGLDQPIADSLSDGLDEELTAPVVVTSAEPAPAEEAVETWDLDADEESEAPFIADEAREMAAFASAADEPPEEAFAGFDDEPVPAYDAPAELSALEDGDEADGVAGQFDFAPEEMLDGFGQSSATAALADNTSEAFPSVTGLGGMAGLDEEIAPSPVAAAAKPAKSAGGGSDFDSVLAELQAEIEANPVGERLEDVLAKEGVVDAVEAIEFTIPQHEHPYTRAMGILEMPGMNGGAGMSEQMVAKSPLAAVQAAAMQAAQSAASAAVSEARRAGVSLEDPMGGLHEGIVTRLSEVLDEMIRDTVRRVVREEVPELMDRLRREESGHGR